MENRQKKKTVVIRTAAAVVTVIAFVSAGLIIGISAKNQRSDSAKDSAKAASAGTAVIYEYKAEYSEGAYTLTDDKTEGNSYPVVIPGTDIPKAVEIELDGANDTACALYLEVAEEFPEDIDYAIDGEKWRPTDTFAAKNGGIVYEYKTEIKPHESLVVSDVIKDGVLHIKDSFDPADVNTLNMELYAYLVQKD